MAKPKRLPKINLSEFKAWLSGVEEMQPDNWSPDVEQWRTIRRKIESIVETEVHVEEVTPTHSAPRFNNLPQLQYAPSGERTAAPATSLQPSGNTPGSLKTPDIDTSSGDYQSSFA